jgi:microcystin-dependent protein
MFPDLFDAIGTTYGAGAGSTTFNLPNYSDGKFPEGSTVAGVVKQPGLPNITSSVIPDRFGVNGVSRSQFGAITITTQSEITDWYAAVGDPQGVTSKLNFDASLSNSIYGASNTVQPYSLTTRFIIKAYDGVTPTPAEADISEMLTELTNKADRDLDNLSADGENHFLENDFTIIYPNGGTEASPANVTYDGRYVEVNPFPGYYVKCVPEILYNNEWGDPRWIFQYVSSSDYKALGVRTNQLNDDTIIVQTGNSGVMGFCSKYEGDPFGVTSVTTTTSAPCRVKVWKIGKIPT